MIACFEPPFGKFEKPLMQMLERNSAASRPVNVV
jgi:hypothetical protein